MNVPDLSIRDLQSIAAVAQHAHFGRAAASLRIAQPTLSAQVQKVERVLSLRLFDRSGRQFNVTPEGMRLLPIVRDLLANASKLVSTADESNANLPAIRLGIIPTLGPYLLPHLLASPGTGRPLPDLTICEHITPDLLRSLLDGTIDAAILSLPIRHESLECIPLFDETFHLLAARGSAILAKSSLTPANLNAKDMVLLEEGHCFRDQALALCGTRRGGTPKLLTTSLETLKFVVAAGGGYSLIPRLAADLPASVAAKLTLRPFDQAPPSRRIALCFRRSSVRRTEIKSLADQVHARLPKSVRAIAPGDGLPRLRRSPAGRS